MSNPQTQPNQLYTNSVFGINPYETIKVPSREERMRFIRDCAETWCEQESIISTEEEFAFNLACQRNTRKKKKAPLVSSWDEMSPGESEIVDQHLTQGNEHEHENVCMPQALPCGSPPFQNDLAALCEEEENFGVSSSHVKVVQQDSRTTLYCNFDPLTKDDSCSLSCIGHFLDAQYQGVIWRTPTVQCTDHVCTCPINYGLVGDSADYECTTRCNGHYVAHGELCVHPLYQCEHWTCNCIPHDVKGMNKTHGETHNGEGIEIYYRCCVSGDQKWSLEKPPCVPYHEFCPDTWVIGRVEPTPPDPGPEFLRDYCANSLTHFKCRESAADGWSLSPNNCGHRNCPVDFMMFDIEDLVPDDRSKHWHNMLASTKIQPKRKSVYAFPDKFGKTWNRKRRHVSPEIGEVSILSNPLRHKQMKAAWRNFPWYRKEKPKPPSLASSSSSSSTFAPLTLSSQTKMVTLSHDPKPNMNIVETDREYLYSMAYSGKWHDVRKVYKQLPDFRKAHAKNIDPNDVFDFEGSDWWTLVQQICEKPPPPPRKRHFYDYIKLFSKQEEGNLVMIDDSPDMDGKIRDQFDQEEAKNFEARKQWRLRTEKEYYDQIKHMCIKFNVGRHNVYQNVFIELQDSTFIQKFAFIQAAHQSNILLPHNEWIVPDPRLINLDISVSALPMAFYDYNGDNLPLRQRVLKIFVENRKPYIQDFLYEWARFGGKKIEDCEPAPYRHITPDIKAKIGQAYLINKSDFALWMASTPFVFHNEQIERKLETPQGRAHLTPKEQEYKEVKQIQTEIPSNVFTVTVGAITMVFFWWMLLYSSYTSAIISLLGTPGYFYTGLSFGSLFAMVVGYSLVITRGMAHTIDALRLGIVHFCVNIIILGIAGGLEACFHQTHLVSVQCYQKAVAWWSDTWIVKKIRSGAQAIDLAIGTNICMPVINMISYLFGSHYLPIFIFATVCFVVIVLYRSRKSEETPATIVVKQATAANKGAMDKIFLICTALMGFTAFSGGSSLRDAVSACGSIATFERLLQRFSNFSFNNPVSADLLQRPDACLFESFYNSGAAWCNMNVVPVERILEPLSAIYKTCNTFVIADAEYPVCERLCRISFTSDMISDIGKNDFKKNLTKGVYDRIVVNLNFQINGKDYFVSVGVLRRHALALKIPKEMFEHLFMDELVVVRFVKMVPITFDVNDDFADHFSFPTIPEIKKSIASGLPPERARNTASMASSVAMVYGKYVALICLLVVGATIIINYVLPYFFDEDVKDDIKSEFVKARQAREKGDKEGEKHHLKMMAYNAQKQLIGAGPNITPIKEHQEMYKPSNGAYANADQIFDRYGRAGDDPLAIAEDMENERGLREADWERKQKWENDVTINVRDGSRNSAEGKRIDNRTTLDRVTDILKHTEDLNPDVLGGSSPIIQVPIKETTPVLVVHNPPLQAPQQEIKKVPLKEPQLIDPKILEGTLLKTPAKNVVNPFIIKKTDMIFFHVNGSGGSGLVSDILVEKGLFHVFFGDSLVSVPARNIYRHIPADEIKKSKTIIGKQIAISGRDKVQLDMVNFAYAIYDSFMQWRGCGFYYRGCLQTCAHVYEGLVNEGHPHVRIVPMSRLDEARSFPPQTMKLVWKTNADDCRDWACIKMSGNLGKHPSPLEWDEDAFYYATLFAREPNQDKLYMASAEVAARGHFIPTHDGCSGTPLFSNNQLLGIHWGHFNGVNCWTPFSEVQKDIDISLSGLSVTLTKQDAIKKDGSIKWFDVLQVHPIPYASDKVICRKQMKYMSEIGFLPRSATLTESKWKDTICTDWHKFKKDIEFDYNDDAFHMANQSFFGVNKSVLKYDQPTFRPDIDQRVLNDSISDLLDLFASLKDSVPIRDYKNVQYEPGTSAGPTLKQFLNLKKKRDASKNPRAREFFEWFWQNAHKEDFPVLFSQAGKVELLKKAKLDNFDIRGFTIAPFEFVLYAGAMDQDLNERMCESSFFNFSPIKHGINMSSGGYRSFLDQLLNLKCKDIKFVEGDCVKWDAALIAYLFWIASMVRFYCWDKKGMSVDEWWSRRRFIYKNNCYSFIVLPTGQVVMKMGGEPSGTVSTTDDNCIYHAFILCVIWRLLTGGSLAADYGKRFGGGLYSDDHLFSVDAAVGFHDFDFRQKIYACFGANLSRDQDKVDDTIHGHKFLGLTFRYDPISKKIVPIFDSLKALNSLGKSDKAFPAHIKLQRAVAFLYLVAFNSLFEKEKVFDAIRRFACRLREMSVAGSPEKRVHIPTESEARCFWYGFE